MTLRRIWPCAVALVAMTAPALAAKPLTDKQRLRDEAEHVCYDDVQHLCSESIPDEDKISACMKSKRVQLSPACRKVFDAGMKL